MSDPAAVDQLRHMLRGPIGEAKQVASAAYVAAQATGDPRRGHLYWLVEALNKALEETNKLWDR